MDRIRRTKIAPEIVSVSKNHCTYPLIFPPTKKISEHRLANGVEVRGIADFNNDGDINYVIGFGDISLNGKRLAGLNKIDGQVLFGILAYFQLKIRKLKKDKKFKDRDIDYSISFNSLYELLTFLKMPTTNPRYYERVKEALYKINNATLYFCKGYYDADEKGFKSKAATFHIFNSLEVVESGGPRKECAISLVLSREWFTMHEAYFVPNDLLLYKKLSEAEVNLRNYLEPWRMKMYQDEKELVRDVRRVSAKIGYGDRPIYKLREALKLAIKAVNREDGKEYLARFEGSNIIFSV